MRITWPIQRMVTITCDYEPKVTYKIVESDQDSLHVPLGLIILQTGIFRDFLNICPSLPILGQSQVHSKMEKKVQRFPIYSLLYYQHHPPEWYIITTGEPTLNIIIIQRPQFTLGLIHSWCFTFMGLNECVMIYMRHHSMIHSTFMALKILFSSYSSLLPLPYAPNSGNLGFTVSTVLPFQNITYLESNSSQLLKIELFHLVICIQNSSISL